MLSTRFPSSAIHPPLHSLLWLFLHQIDSSFRAVLFAPVVECVNRSSSRRRRRRRHPSCVVVCIMIVSEARPRQDHGPCMIISVIIHNNSPIVVVLLIDFVAVCLFFAVFVCCFVTMRCGWGRAAQEAQVLRKAFFFSQMVCDNERRALVRLQVVQR